MVSKLYQAKNRHHPPGQWRKSKIQTAKLKGKKPFVILSFFVVFLSLP